MTTPSCKGNWEMQTFSWEAMYEAKRQSSFSKRETDPGFKDLNLLKEI